MVSSHETLKGAPDARTIALVEASWAEVQPIADVTAMLFYGRLFDIDPALRPLFKTDLREQRKKLLASLGVAVEGLRQPAKLLPVLRSLGVRHVGYGVVDHHYAVVGEALIGALRGALGESFTKDVEAAWREVYGFIAAVMMAAAAEHRPAPPSASRPVSSAAPHAPR